MKSPILVLKSGAKYSGLRKNIIMYKAKGKTSNILKTKFEEAVIVLSSFISFFLLKNSLSIVPKTFIIFPPVLLSNIKLEVIYFTSSILTLL